MDDQRPVFQTQAQGINALFFISARLSSCVGWLAVATAHLLLLVMLLIALWWFQVTPAGVTAAVQQMLQSTTAAALGAVGVSGASLVAGWTWLMKKLHRSLGGLIAKAVLPRP